MLTNDLIQEFYTITEARAQDLPVLGLDGIRLIEAMLADAPTIDED